MARKTINTGASSYEKRSDGDTILHASGGVCQAGEFVAARCDQGRWFGLLPNWMKAVAPGEFDFRRRQHAAVLEDFEVDPKGEG